MKLRCLIIIWGVIAFCYLYDINNIDFELHKPLWQGILWVNDSSGNLYNDINVLIEPLDHNPIEYTYAQIEVSHFNKNDVKEILASFADSVNKENNK